MVKRYDLEQIDYDYYKMVESISGDYVEYKDYEEMSDQYIDLKIKYDRLVSDIGDLYREG